MRINLNKASATLAIAFTITTGCLHPEEVTDTPTAEVETVYGGEDVDLSAYTAENGPQDFTDLGYQNQLGIPTLALKFPTEQACYAGINAAGTEYDWSADNLCAQPNPVQVDDTGTTYVLFEFDPGASNVEGFYEGNIYDNGDESCGPEVTNFACWGNLEGFNYTPWITVYENDNGDVTTNLILYSTYDGLHTYW